MHDTVSAANQAQDDPKNSALEKSSEKASVKIEEDRNDDPNSNNSNLKTEPLDEAGDDSNRANGEAMDIDEPDTATAIKKEESNSDGGGDVEMEDVSPSGNKNKNSNNSNSAENANVGRASNGDTLKNGDKSQSANNSNNSGGDGGSAVKNSPKAATAAATVKIENVANNGSTAAADTAVPPNPVPIMKGTLFWEDKEKGRRHIIRGNWQYESNSTAPPQRFELQRVLAPDEDLKKIPANGEFSGSFSLSYTHKTSKGKVKERSKVIQENGVEIKFEKLEDGSDGYNVSGQGTNQFGIFHISGTAVPSAHKDDEGSVMEIEFRKGYEPPPVAPPDDSQPTNAKGKSSKSSNKAKGAGKAADKNAPLPDPSPSFATGVYCLRGKLFRVESAEDVGIGEVVHRIDGLWGSGLDQIVADPENTAGKLSKFQYDHKSMVVSSDFPISGRYSGWFDLIQDGGTSRVVEKDVALKFKKNNAGYYNIEGKGSNAFGKYTISGSLTSDNIITLFRHFILPRKDKPPKNVTSAPPPINEPQAKRASIPAASVEAPKLKLEDVTAPTTDAKDLAPFNPPVNQTYSAVSQGSFRVNKDGTHSCQGKWAMARDHLANDAQTSTFNVRLEAHDANAAAEKAGKDPSTSPFPLDSAMYKGSFQLKKQGSGRGKPDTIIDQQVVMKFRKNSQGSYNVYGKGVNAIGMFDLFGTLICVGGTGGRIELYRTYPTNMLNNAQSATGKVAAASANKQLTAPNAAAPSADTTKSQATGAPAAGAQRRESTRLVKLPSKLEDDDPKAQLNRAMDKCAQVLRTMKEKDLAMGAYFREPVDPVALGIPTYYQVIKEPMDLKTLTRKMDANEVGSPEEFARLMKLIFENAIKFNIDPAHSVHRAARQLLILFNQKWRDIDRVLQKLRKEHGLDADDKGKKGQDGKNKRGKKGQQLPEKPKTPREIRMEEAQAMATENTKAVSAIVAAAPKDSQNVSRNEFNMLLRMIEQMQQQLAHTHTLLAGLFPGDEAGAATAAPTQHGAASAVPAAPSVVPVAAAATDNATTPTPNVPRKKPTNKRKSDALKEQVAKDDSTPLTIEEQTFLTETINELDPEHLNGVIQIIREAAPIGADEDEIDLEIDQLDHKTQRKLLQHVSKFVKKKPQPKAKKQKTSTASKRSKSPPVQKQKPVSPRPAPAPAPSPKPKPPGTFFLFGNKDDSDSDSDEEGEVTPAKPQNAPAPAPAAAAPAPAPAEKKREASFKLGSGLGVMDDDKDDDDDDGDFDFGSGATSWNISKPAEESEKKDGDDDDAWGAAREAAAATKAREAERKAREKKIEAEAENAKNQRLAEAAARGEEIKAQRAEEEAKEAELREQQEKEAEEARKAAKEAAKAQLETVEQTVDLDATRDLMKQYETSYADGDYGSASPSSDFGF